MENTTFALALVLGAGLLIAKLAQLCKLPSVTGYICAGLALGPSGFGMISREMIEGRLGHFTQIALMLIAFGIGEHLEFKKLRHTAKSVLSISFFEDALSFMLVTYGTFFILYITNIGQPGWSMIDCVSVAFLLGSIAIATAPASTLHVMRELKATGPMTTTLLQVVVINNGIAVIMFGIVISVVGNLVSGAGDLSYHSLISSLGSSLWEISASLLMGVATGLLIDFIVRRLNNRGEMLIAGLSLLLLCGEAARLLDYSPLLAGMAAGFAIVNQDLRDVRLFRLLNSFEPPIYVLFFALAGAHLEISYFATAGWLGATYFIFRAAGKYLGASFGARITSASAAVRDNIGLALIPQAGIAIGLVFLINEHAGLARYSTIITTVVLTSVFISELVGPICTKFAMQRAGEAVSVVDAPAGRKFYHVNLPSAKNPGDFHLIPWTWERLQPANILQGVVVFGVSNIKTLGGLTRMATIMAHHHNAVPMATRIMPTESSMHTLEFLEDTHELFSCAREEAFQMGYQLETNTVPSDGVAEGLLQAARVNHTKAIVLGHPLPGEAHEFHKVVENVVLQAPCPVIVVRFCGVLHTEKILVPITSINSLEILKDVVISLSAIGRHRVTLLYLVPPDTADKEIEESRAKLFAWTKDIGFPSAIRSQVATAEARLQTIIDEAKYHDLIVVNASPSLGLKRLFFGSLAESVAQHCGKTVLMVHSALTNEE